jgi:IS605 OrfB family transposase
LAELLRLTLRKAIRAGHGAAAIQIDLGLKDFAVLRGGRTIDSPKFFRMMERKLKRAQQVLSRKQAGSANREQARIAVARLHERVRDRRDDWLHKQVKAVLDENQAVYVEDLNIKGLARGRASKSLHDQAFGRFLDVLESQAARRGRAFAKVDRFFPSTQLCSACGALSGPRGLEGLSIRSWKCACGEAHDRDANAEVDIRREGWRILHERSVAAGHAETRNAPGGRVSPGTPGTVRNRIRAKNGEPIRTGDALASP